MSQPITVTDILRRARQIITPPEKWHKGGLSNGVFGAPETAYCAMGAVIQAGNELGGRFNSDFEQETMHWLTLTCGECVTHYNDLVTTTHEDVLRIFDKAIGGK